LVQHFLERKSADLKLGAVPKLADGAIDILTAYDWPGNVRELANVVERAMILHRDQPLRFDELGVAPQSPTASPTPNYSDDTLLLDQVIKRHIERVLTMADGKIHGPGGAGELLGVNPNTLRSRMTKLGVQKKPT
jgi:DNA-binding NtrC family response regulator